MTGQKQVVTELKFVWTVNMTGNCSKIILSSAWGLTLLILYSLLSHILLYFLALCHAGKTIKLSGISLEGRFCPRLTTYRKGCQLPADLLKSTFVPLESSSADLGLELCWQRAELTGTHLTGDSQGVIHSSGDKEGTSSALAVSSLSVLWEAVHAFRHSRSIFLGIDFRGRFRGLTSITLCDCEFPAKHCSGGLQKCETDVGAFSGLFLISVGSFCKYSPSLAATRGLFASEEFRRFLCESATTPKVDQSEISRFMFALMWVSDKLSPGDLGPWWDLNLLSPGKVSGTASEVLRHWTLL